jgi:hypothetical protein
MTDRWIETVPSHRTKAVTMSLPRSLQSARRGTIGSMLPMSILQAGHQVHRGRVMVVSPASGDRFGHDALTREHVAREVAAALGYAFCGEHDRRESSIPVYAVPHRTLLASEAGELRIRSEVDLLGGVVPHAFLGGKTITHAVVSPEAAVPAHWSHGLAARLRGVVLPGYSAFSRADARRAALAMLERGPVRLKRAGECGGTGQYVVADAAQVENVLAGIDDEEWLRDGMVVEQQLEEAVTYSIGSVRLGNARVAYVGTQRTVRNHHGHDVYGGSDLNVWPGGFDALAQRPMPAPVAAACAMAMQYDAAVSAEFPGFFASRRNYDVVHGRDAAGAQRMGVLEQSWRIGGATPAEIAALRAFADDARLQSVQASTHEAYGRPEPPPHAIVYFDDREQRIGGLVKYCTVDARGYTA